MSNLLVVDWDYFFPTVPPKDSPFLFDWGHSETNPLYYEIVWPFRAGDFKAHGLPLPPLSGDELTFWSRVSVAPEASLFLADSNSFAAHAQVRAGVRSVWLFDAHHDSGYHKSLKQLFRAKTLSCEDWTFAYFGVADVHVRYPPWHKTAFQSDPAPTIPGIDRQTYRRREKLPRFDKVFVCRSPAWTPPWHDKAFDRFVADAKREVTVLSYLGPREWESSMIPDLPNLKKWFARQAAAEPRFSP